jgi:hypothetical protein
MASIAERTIVTTFQEIAAQPAQIPYNVAAQLETPGLYFLVTCFHPVKKILHKHLFI